MRTIHLIRHGEVANPNHVVYADLPGFDLSPVGVLQAHCAGRHLAARPLDAVVTSPLARARHTAVAIARSHGLSPIADPRLTETGAYPGWTGRRWEELDDRFPGQLEAYLHDPAMLPDASETLAEAAARVLAVIDDAGRRGLREVALVGHQDPTQAARFTLTGRPLDRLLDDPPAHGAVISLEHDGSNWHEVARFVPAATSCPGLHS